MKAIVSTNSTKGLLAMAVGANNTAAAQRYANITSSTSANINKDMELSLDISSVNQVVSPEIGAIAEGNTSAVTTTVKAWWFE
ncbi:MAG: hypothetical protein E7420_00580 [Ruminococcaceae bacterium]|nr:hypothetical protein [Oscillospiraceae bacterium]